MLMTCRHVRQLHDAFIDGELSPSLTAEVHAHLLQCSACQREVEATRAASDVIHEDHSEPMLDSGFAMRVVAALPKRSAAPVLPARDQRRERFLRMAFRAGLPAAAAVLFLSVLFWPRGESPVRRTVVAGMAVEAAGVNGVVNPTLDAVAGTRQAAQTLDRLLQLSTGQARQTVRERLATLGRPTDSGPTVMDVLMMPFDGVFQPKPESQADSKPGDEVVRF